MAKNFKKATHKQKRISYSLKTKLDQDQTKHKLDEYVTKKLKAKLKSPGPDGVPYEFMLVMWKEIRSLVFRMIEWFFRNKVMPKSILEGQIVFLPKKGKDKTLIKNLRPLTLLNTIYKIASGMMAERIKKVLPTIISKSQYGFTEGKQAADLVEIARQMLGDANEKKKNLVIFAIDFSGAFDNVSYKAIIRALYWRVFGKNIITSIATLLSGNSSKIVVNGRCKGAIYIEKSCRQGDPLSPYLFIIVLDQLLDNLNRARSLKGYELRVQDKNIKLTAAAFADNCYAFLTGREESIKKQFETVKKILKKFEEETGIKINVNKSELTASGPVATEKNQRGDSVLEIGGIKNKGNIRMLGVNIGTESNIKDDVQKTLEKSINFWKKFKYNEIDKIEISNAFVIPSIIHMLRHVPFDRAFEDKINKTILDFIWENKKLYISKDIMFEKTKNGGMGALAVGKVWIKVLLSWYDRTIDESKKTQILEIAQGIYRKEYGHEASKLFIHGIMLEKRIKKSNSVLKSTFELQRFCWANFLDDEPFEAQPSVGNKRILKDILTVPISRENLPAFEDATIPTTLWLKGEIEKIENKYHKTLTDILTEQLTNRLDPRLSVLRETNKKHLKRDILRKFKKSRPSAIVKILKLKTDAVKERILKIARKTLVGKDPQFAKFKEKSDHEIKKRNQSGNAHLDNKLIRIRQKIKYGALITNDKLHEWGLIKEKNCSFCGKFPEDIDHLLSWCEILGPLWEKAKEITQQKWRITQNLLDKKMGMRLESGRERKAEKLFLKIVWQL